MVRRREKLRERPSREPSFAILSGVMLRQTMNAETLLAAYEAELAAHSTKSIHHLAIGGWRIDEAEALGSPVQVLFNAVRDNDVQPLRLPGARGVSIKVSATSDLRRTEARRWRPPRRLAASCASAPCHCSMSGHDSRPSTRGDAASTLAVERRSGLERQPRKFERGPHREARRVRVEAHDERINFQDTLSKDL